MSMERNLKNNKLDLLAQINEAVTRKYGVVNIGNQICSKNGNGVFFRIYAFQDRDAFCVEYAENENGASRGIFGEDGDLFYMDEFETPEEMERAIIAEIDEVE